MNRVGLLLAGFSLLVISPTAPAQKPNANSRSNPEILSLVADVSQRASEATVRILGDGRELVLGTIVDPDGWILTKFSELKGVLTVRLKDGREFPANLVGAHSDDLAMLKIEATGLPVVEWRNSTEDAVGSWVITPGLGRDPIAVGVISVLARDLPPTPAFSPNPNSGYMGIVMQPADGGVRVVSVAADTPAAKAGLKEGDIIFSIDGQGVATNDDVLAILRGKKPGDVIRVAFLRDGGEREVELKLARRPFEANRGEFQNRMGSNLSDRRGGFANVLQHDTVLQPSECGGPLVDLDGKTIGINIARAGRTETFAIPAERIIPLIASFKAGKFPVQKPAVKTVADRIKELQEAIKRAIADEEEGRKAKLAAEQQEAEARKRRQALEAELKKLQGEENKK
ncbi:MAG: PDZ domain-containing protein [Gemmataceae bacterium]|nr:PDZ domain-containing protein [Gemmataceae bacterium]